MKNTFAKMFTVCALAGVLGFALSACDDSSSAGGDDNVILSGDSREESSDSRSNDKDEAISSSGKSTDPAEVTDDSSDSKDNPSSAGTSTKSSNSNTSGNDAKSNSSAGKVNCSALLEGWSWDVPKECLFNPDIDYGTMTDERDGKVYRTVQIGDQVWMAENLNYSDSTKTPSLLKRNWCYNDNVANCEVAGRLYTWAAAMDSVALYDGGNGVDCGYGKNCMVNDTVYGICPPGWHLPAYMEWQALFDEVGGQSAAGSFFKSLTGWYSGGNGIDVYGFSALPVGNYYNGYFTVDGRIAVFWSTMESEYRNEDAYGVALGNNDDGAYLNKYEKNAAFSVRCIKDFE